MRFTVLLLACVLAATAAYSHDGYDLPELPIPVIDQLFPVDDMAAALRLADRPLWTGWGFDDDAAVVRWATEFFNSPLQPRSDRWYIVALSEGSFRQVGELLAGIQQPLNNIIEIPEWDDDFCKGLDGRFGVYLQGWSQGREDDEFLWTFGAGLRSNGGGYRQSYVEPGGFDFGWSHYYLKNRFSVAGGDWDAATDLHNTGFSMRFRFTLVDDAHCADAHITHSGSSTRHGRQRHSYTGAQHDGPWTDWLPVADLLDGTVAATSPAPEVPEAPEAPEAPETPAADNSAELAQLRAANAALRGSLLALQSQIDALEAAAGGTTTTITLVDTVEVARVDTVEVARVDTLHYCPPSDEDRQDLFDAFTGVNSDTSGTGGAGKATAVRPSSWGAIKALIQQGE